MIHGLFSTPLAWAELSNELWADDSVRRIIYICVPHRGSNYADNFLGRVKRILKEK